MDAVIELYEGKLGGGKTYACVKRMVNCILDGWVVQSNIQLNWAAVEEYARKRSYRVDPKQYVHLEHQFIEQFYEHVCSGEKTLLVLDECHLWFSAREWKNTAKKVQEVLTQARKLQLHILLITQHRKNLACDFVRQVQYFWQCRDLQKWKVLGLRWPFPVFIQLCCAGETNTVIEKRTIYKDKEIFGLYESKDLLKPLQLGFERPDLNCGKINPRRRSKASLLAAAAVGVGCGFVAGGMRESNAVHPGAADPAAAGPSRAVAVHPGAAAAAVSEPERRYHGLYQLRGEYFADLGEGWQPLPRVVSVDRSGAVRLFGGEVLRPVRPARQAAPKGERSESRAPRGTAEGEPLGPIKKQAAVVWPSTW